MMSLCRTMVLIAVGAVLAGCAATMPQQLGAAGPKSPGAAGTSSETEEGTLYIGIGTAQAGEDDSRSKSRTDAERLAWLDAVKKAFGVRVEEYLKTKDGILIESTSNLTAGGELIYRGREKEDSFDGTTYTVWLRAEKRRVPAEPSRFSRDASPEAPKTGADPSAASTGSAAGSASVAASRAEEASGAGLASGAATAPTVSQAEKECAAEDEAFKSAKKSGKWLDYARYISNYPDSRHKKEAQILLELAKNRKFLRKPFREKVRDEVCTECPLMVVVPPGCFMIGSENGDEDERPKRPVTIEYPFAVGVYEVTRGQWQRCHRANVHKEGVCDVKAQIDHYTDKDYPMTGISFDDALQYVRWLSERSEKKYRLLSESEWEYVARAGTSDKYWWGNHSGQNRANCDGCVSNWDRRPAPVGQFDANKFGLHDVHGNAGEFVMGCWIESYEEPQLRLDGKQWNLGDCSSTVVRGGSWSTKPEELRSANRIRITTKDKVPANKIQFRSVGFRVARTLKP